ncbi:uncharacterized protein LOC129792393 [Lutzomyia longipalpis]|uniref:uncharacterized protein LOC129792393 n=1 Tax=Lutzomyia longipalpis TaxID=7200 RepID=UPI002483FE93|nr:uncharacterized protein LOC129792393 [Lutzomyia longipalpis]
MSADGAKNRTNWLAQFGLYRDVVQDEKETKKSWKPTLGLYLILGCSILLILAVFFILQELFTEQHEFIEFPTLDRPTIFPTESSLNVTDDWTNATVNPTLGENITEIVSEKLVLRPSKFLRPPPPPKDPQRRSAQPPRPFEFELHEPYPSSFRKPNATVSRVNNIQDILQQLREPADEGSGKIRRVHISGKYRTPGKMLQYRAPRRTTVMPYTRTTERSFELTTSSPPADIFHNYKPQAPSDVNLMATKQFRFAPYLYKTVSPSRGNHRPFYHYATESSVDLSSLYHDLIDAEKNRGKASGSRDESSQSIRNKPFSLMLDIYPVHGEEEKAQTTKKPYVNPLDTSSYYSTINFPQIPQNPHLSHSYYNNMYFKGPYGSTKEYNWAYPDTTPAEETVNKPSQMVVHLNLYPKNKKRFGRINSEADKRALSNEQNVSDSFQPIHPKVYFNSRPLDEQMEDENEPDLGVGTAVEIPKTISPFSSTTIYYPNNSTSYVEIVRSVELTTPPPIAPYSGNRAIVVFPESSYPEDHMQTFPPRGNRQLDIATDEYNTERSKVHNSQQPDNPMVVSPNKHRRMKVDLTGKMGEFEVPPGDLIRFDSNDAIQMH